MAEAGLGRAVERVQGLFAGRFRKETEIPYLAHLLEVAALTLAAGGDEEQAVAALLHDALEDVPDEITAERIEAEFGQRVLMIVQHCTDSEPGEGRGASTWFARKTRYVAALAEAPVEALVVSLADKLANARAIVADARVVGPRFWERFNAGPARQRWYYESLRLVFTERLAGDRCAAVLLDDFRHTVDELARLATEAEQGR